MSAAVWPPISHDALIQEEEASLARELEWLLNSLQESLASFKSGLEDCIALLAPQEPGATLVLSSHRSESVKGFVTRVGTRIIKGDIHLRLPTLPGPRNPHPPPPNHPPPPPQLTTTRALINQALDIIDVSTWTGDAHSAPFISGQLRLLHENITEARQTLRGGEESLGNGWPSPPPPPLLSFHLSIHDAALVLHLRTLSPTPPADSTFSRLLGLAAAPPSHDETGRTFVYGGQEVRVREKVRVESQDPSLMAVMAKLSAVGHGVGFRAVVVPDLFMRLNMAVLRWPRFTQKVKQTDRRVYANQ
ncbi:MAG: hypothetical protein FRX48_08084 [Lasallia pustulata]|uniref:RAVE subunit 2/Rogdi n=1 Tax=Lasallia pustulata TaxID=136370 RepID=A0A5M8PI97_9LECA|nr:MAG: hypothetical protein FRX48_08084 [Lasallia pustulata]